MSIAFSWLWDDLDLYTRSQKNMYFKQEINTHCNMAMASNDLEFNYRSQSWPLLLVKVIDCLPKHNCAQVFGKIIHSPHNYLLFLFASNLKLAIAYMHVLDEKLWITRVLMFSFQSLFFPLDLVSVHIPLSPEIDKVKVRRSSASKHEKYVLYDHNVPSWTHILWTLW